MISANIRKPFLKLLPIQVAAIVVGSVNSLVDTVFTGRYLGGDAVAGVGFFSPLMTIIYLCYVVLNGTQILCGKAVGRGKSDEVTSLFSTAFVTVLGYGLFLTLGVLAFREPLISLLGAKGQAAVFLRDYIIGFMPGVPFLMISGQMMMFLPCNNELSRSYVVMGIMIVSNLLLDTLAIRVLGMGTLGLGLASALSYTISVVILLPRFRRKDKAYRLKLHSIHFPLMKDACRLGLPELAFNLGITVRSYIMNMTVLGYIGNAGVAVLNVQNSLLAFLGAVPVGTSVAYTILACIYYGEKDRKSLRSLTIQAYRLGCVLGAVLMVILIAGSSVIAGLFFQAGTENYDLARQMLTMFSSCFIFNTILSIQSRAYQMQNYVNAVNFLKIIEQVLTAAVAAIGIRLIGIPAVWISFPAADFLCLIIIIIWNTISRKRFPKSVEDQILLPEDFGAAKEDVLEFTVSGLEEVTRVSREIMAFCEKKGISHRRSMIAGLSVEELAGNVIQYGLRKKHKNLIEVRVVAEDESLIIRIRDNCTAFDPKQYIDQFYPEDPAKNVGIRMIGKLAESMEYHNDAGINTLLIRI